MYGFGHVSPASANEWKMGPISQSAEIIQEARELQDTERREFLCLALAVLHESRGEPERGQVAVAHVILNRVKSGEFPKTICGVVWQRSQFSWSTRPVGSLIPRGEQWEQAQRVASGVINGITGDPTKGCDHFHARSRRPGWAGRAKFRLNIGGHVFMRLLSK